PAFRIDHDAAAHASPPGRTGTAGPVEEKPRRAEVAAPGSFACLVHGRHPGPIDAGIDEALLETGARAAAAIVAHELAAHALAFHLEVEHVIERRHIAFHATHIGDLRHPSLAVALTLDLHDEIHRTDNLGEDRAGGQTHVAHLHHVLDAGQGIARVVGMDGGHAAVVAGVHRLEHVERLRAA